MVDGFSVEVVWRFRFWLEVLMSRSFDDLNCYILGKTLVRRAMVLEEGQEPYPWTTALVTRVTPMRWITKPRPMLLPLPRNLWFPATARQVSVMRNFRDKLSLFVWLFRDTACSNKESCHDKEDAKVGWSRDLSEVWQVGLHRGAHEGVWEGVAQVLLHLPHLQQEGGQRHTVREGGRDLLQVLLRQEFRAKGNRVRRRGWRPHNILKWISIRVHLNLFALNVDIIVTGMILIHTTSRIIFNSRLDPRNGYLHRKPKTN